MATTDVSDVVGTYKHGSIRRVKLRNFLTYSDVEVEPGPRLNMVIGPNGTGKSTILCAICLGLGGEPALLGRASDIETFVANGEDEGEIELEIVNAKGGSNVILRRQLRRTGSPKSACFWNDQKLPPKTIKEKCLATFQITVDNLCTFLPQDKVGNFSAFNPQQLLIETEKSLSASQHLYHTHQELIRHQEETKGDNNRLATLESKLDQLKHEGERLGRARALIEERDIAQAQADLLRKKILWLEFDALLEDLNQKKAAKAEIKEKLREASATLRPFEERWEKAKLKLKRSSTEYDKYKNEIRTHKKEMDKHEEKYQKHDDMIEGIMSDLQVMDQQREDKKLKLTELRQRVESYKANVADGPSMDALQEEELQCRNEQRAILPRYDESKREQERLLRAKAELEEEYRQAQQQMNRLQDDKARRNDRIFRSLPDLKKILDWVDQNRTKFRKSVVGPVMCEVTPKSGHAASYLEHQVANSTLKSFVVQCKEDYDLLYRSVRQGLNLPINVLLITHIKPIKRVYSEDKMRILKKEHGVIGYMDETIAAPDLVLEALRSSSQIHRVLIGSEQTQASLDSRNLLDYLSQPENGSGKLQACSIFATDGTKANQYTSIISKYSGKPSVRVDDIRPAKFLAPGVADDRKAKVQEELDKIESRRSALQPQVDAASDKRGELEEKAQIAKARLTEVRGKVQVLQKVINKLRNAEAKLSDAEAELAVGDQQEKENKVAELNKRLHHSLVALEKHSESYKLMMKATVKSSGALLNKEAAAAEESANHYALQDATREFKSLEDQARMVAEQFKRAKSEVIRQKQNADRQAPLEDGNGNDLPLKAQLEELPVSSLDEAGAALEEAQAKVDSIVADNGVIQEHERNLAETADIQAQLDDMKASEERRKIALQEKVAPWRETLEEAVTKIDHLFSRYMSEMGKTGEIRLTTGGESDDDPNGDFSKWGIEIRVSFRENTKLQVLSARVQSGGERSVSTILYLMALQDLMVSPFRCVDEINQGLDERNERLVFKRIVANSTRVPGPQGPTDHAGQYFLITPKLLPNLYDMEVEAMTVLFIFNGPYNNIRDHNDWKVRNLLPLRKRETAKIEAMVGDENSGSAVFEEEGPPSKMRKRQHRKALAASNGVEAM
eukprot:Nitzschia sp. Nitz4//scaffold11_size288233//84805//88427//NITZ4_000754-RA/size288233-snap-gene-0.15-mRNA-1//1//CDS//3329534014//2917//frame0